MADTPAAGPPPGAVRTSPAAHLAELMRSAGAAAPRRVGLRELPWVAMTGLRAVPGSGSARAVAQYLGGPLPERCGEVTGGTGWTALWLGPQEFLVVGPLAPAAGDDPARQAAGLAAALGERPGAAVDLSANRTIVELSGPAARQVLAKGCALDLHPRAFPAPRAVTTAVGLVPAIVWKVAAERYLLLPRASFTEVLVRWLADAMREFSGPPIS